MNQINIRKALGQSAENKSVELVGDVEFVRLKKYPNRCRTCVACNHKCAKVQIIKLTTKLGNFNVEFGEDCLKRFLGKKSKKIERETDGVIRRQYTVICSNKECKNMNLHSRCRFNNNRTTFKNSQDWFIQPYICDSCDKISNPDVSVVLDRQYDIEQHYLKIVKRFGKNLNPIDNRTFKSITISYIDSNFRKSSISSIMLLLDNIKKYPNNDILLHKFILYYINKSREDKSQYNSLQFLPKTLLTWWIRQDYDYIVNSVLGVKKCLILDDCD